MKTARTRNLSLTSAFILGSLAVALCVGTSFAQDAAQKSWGILQQAASDSNEQKRVQAVSVLGLIQKNAQAQAQLSAKPAGKK